MSEKYLYRFEWDCGRAGDLEGLFVATEEEVANLTGTYLYFGEVLGKFSEVCGTVEKGEIVKLDLDANSVAKVSALLGESWSGYNPLAYVRYDCDECGDRLGREEMHNESICNYCARRKRNGTVRFNDRN